MPDTTDFDSVIRGERKSAEVPGVDTGVAVKGDRLTVDIELAQTANEVTLVVTGDQTSIQVKGFDATLNVFHTGSRNTIVVDEALDLNSQQDTGERVSLKRDEFTTEDEIEAFHESRAPTADEVIQTRKQEAYAEIGLLGSATVTYQTEATDAQDWCPSCGSDAEIVVNQRTERVLSVFGLKMQLKTVSEYQECENCIDTGDVELTEDERQDLFD